MGAIPGGWPPFDMLDAEFVLLDDLDDAAGARLDQDRATVHDRVAIFTRGGVFRRHVVIGDALLGEHRANPNILAVLIGRAALLDDIAVEARAVIDAENAVDATDHPANDAADHGADRTGRPFAFARASLNTARDPLGLRHDRQRNGGDNGSNSDKTADHDIS